MVIKGWGSWSPVTNWQRPIAGNNIILIAIVMGIFKCKKYIDKTRFIEMLELESNASQFFIHPRKFGKSLFFAVLKYYYDIKYADQFEQLFGDLYNWSTSDSRKK
ncbi:MAG: AAA family ATPase [Planctomycetaceae bacterium]|nr:AAA family ATPase [Planctomycetaceae bacterium]